MNRSTIIGIAIGGSTALSLGAVASYQVAQGPRYAEVVDVTEVKKTVSTPEQQCEDVQVTHRRPAKDQHRIAGTLIGGLLGGVLGHQVGGGRGNTLATVGGAAAGGYAGNQLQKNMQEKDATTSTEHRCKTINTSHDEVVAYDVKYTLAGKPGTVRMTQRPGERIPVKDGQLVLDDATKAPVKS